MQRYDLISQQASDGAQGKRKLVAVCSSSDNSRLLFLMLLYSM